MNEHPIVIVGLGNPGREYRENRHNIGFMLVDQLAVRLNIALNRFQFKALVGTGIYSNQRIVLAKPQTFMNLSGQSVQGLVRFYKLPLENLLVAHDDLDLPFGTIRMRPSGGSAGQKGIASIIQQLGIMDFPRLRMGIGRPPGRMEASDYVLQDFSKDEHSELGNFLYRAADAAQEFVRFGLSHAMNRFNPNVENGTVS